MSEIFEPDARREAVGQNKPKTPAEQSPSTLRLLTHGAMASLMLTIGGQGLSAEPPVSADQAKRQPEKRNFMAGLVPAPFAPDWDKAKKNPTLALQYRDHFEKEVADIKKKIQVKGPLKALNAELQDAEKELEKARKIYDSFATS